MELSSAIFDLLHEERRREIHKGIKGYTFIAVFPELTQKVTQLMYIAADCCLQTDKVIVMLSMILQSKFNVQLLYKLYSVQLKCTYSNYTEAAATCSAAQTAQHSYSKNTVPTVQFATELYLQ